MSEVATNGPMTFNVADGTALSKYQLLTMTASGDVEPSGTTDDVVGVCQNEVPADASTRTRGNTASVVPMTHSGVLRFIAAGPVSLNAPLFKAANGGVDDTGTEALGFKCITPNITAAGDVLEAIPFV